VMLEPMNVADPAPGFLEGVKALTHKHGAVLVFDETITGFRYANGGAQELFGVTPDLATFGKGLANGYPVSAIAGRRDLMKMMEEVFFSFTFGGETLSLAAARATLLKLQREPVVNVLIGHGNRIMGGVRKLIDQHQMQDWVATSGHPTWSFLSFKDHPSASSWVIKTYWMQEILQRGLLSVGSHNVSYAHSDADIDALLGAYAEVLPAIGHHLAKGDLAAQLRCAPLVPLFKVR
jgi:glutamate-1-semialdehyde 2,1-aminomutase